MARRVSFRVLAGRPPPLSLFYDGDGIDNCESKPLAWDGSVYAVNAPDDIIFTLGVENMLFYADLCSSSTQQRYTCQLYRQCN